MSNEFRILLAIDLKNGTDQLLTEVERYSRALDAVVDIIHVAEPSPDFVSYVRGGHGEMPGEGDIQPDEIIRDDKAKSLRSEHEQTQDVGARLRASGIRVDKALTVQGPTFETIIKYVDRLGSDLLVLGSHQQSGIYRFWYGNIVADTVNRAPCVMLVVPVES